MRYKVTVTFMNDTSFYLNANYILKLKQYFRLINAKVLTKHVIEVDHWNHTWIFLLHFLFSFNWSVYHILAIFVAPGQAQVDINPLYNYHHWQSGCATCSADKCTGFNFIGALDLPRGRWQLAVTKVMVIILNLEAMCG